MRKVTVEIVKHLVYEYFLIHAGLIILDADTVMKTLKGRGRSGIF